MTAFNAPLPAFSSTRHAVLGTELAGPWPAGTEVIYLAMGCFWGVEKTFWRLDGVVVTAAGYLGGHVPNPSYLQVCSAMTGHAETVMVAYDPQVVTATELLRVFWENHDPTQGDRQGPDSGPQYRSVVFWTTAAQAREAEASRDAFAEVLTAAGRGPITTEILPAAENGPFWFAEEYHQAYLHKNPAAACTTGPTGFVCPIG